MNEELKKELDIKMKALNKQKLILKDDTKATTSSDK
jgi:hypothetical protein